MTLICSRCDSAITAEDLGNGLAVRVDGELICHMCVDTLPGEAVVRINQIRAIRGLEVTTYQVKRTAQPRLQLYSFTTSSNITNHRRKLASDGFFEAPPLPPPAERLRLTQPPTPKPVTDRIARGLPPARTPMLIAGGITVLVLGGIALGFSLAASGKNPAPPVVDGTPQELPRREPAKPMKTRLDYPVEPLQAWTLATQDRDCPTYVRQAIAQEIVRKRSQQLDDAERALVERRLDDANALANAMMLPDDIAFRDLRGQETDLRARLLTSRTVASLPPTPAPVPTAVPETPPPATPASDVITAGADGSLRLVADAATIAGISLKAETRKGVRNLGFWTNAGDSASWQVHIARPGSYRIEARQATGGGDSVLAVEIAGQEIAGRIANTGSWDTFKTAAIGVVSITTPGDHRLRVRGHDPATWRPINLAELVLRPTSEAPSPAAPAPLAVLPCWSVPAAQLLVADAAGWKRETYGLRLQSARGAVRRGVMLAAGDYRVWIKIEGRSPDAALACVVGGQRARPVTVGRTQPSAWMAIEPASGGSFTLPAGETVLELLGATKDLLLIELLIADPALPPPAEIEARRLKKPVAFGPLADTTATTSLPGGTLLQPRFLQAGAKELVLRPLPTDGSVHLPSGWPGGVDGYFRSGRNRGKRHVLMLDLAGANALNGGLVVLLHPLRPDRRQLQGTLTDGAGRTAPLPPITFSANDWTTVVIPTAGLGLQADQLVTLVLEDEAQQDSLPEEAGFLLGRLAAVADTEPTAAHLGIRPPALVRDDNRLKNLPKLLDTMWRARKRGDWKKNTELARMRVLVAEDFVQDWRAEARRRIESDLGIKSPGPMFLGITFQEAWFDDMANKGKNSAVDPQQHHLALLLTGGGELALGPAAVDGFWKKRLEQLLSVGVLPVVVLGPNRQSGARRAEVEKVWADLVELLGKRQYGFPIIDLRSVTTSDNGGMDAANAELAMNLLVDGLEEFAWALRRLGALK
jgi:hypothetical protein